MPFSTGMYNIVIFGEPNVGKTCFIDQFCYGKSFVIYDPDVSALSHKIVVNGRTSDLILIDLSTSFLKPEQGSEHIEWAINLLADADGIVLLYDVTSLESFEYVTNQAYKYLWSCRRSKCESEEEVKGKKRIDFGCVLAGNKLDLVGANTQRRKVSHSLAAEWAQTQGIRSIEVDSLAREGPESALKLLVNNIRMIERLEERYEDRKAQEMGMREQRNSIRSNLREVMKTWKA